MNTTESNNPASSNPGSTEDWRTRLTDLIADYRSRTPDKSRNRYQRARDWQAELDDHGLAAPAWPREVGGLDLALDDLLDYYRITSAAKVPSHPCPLSMIVAPTLIAHGTDAQKERFLKPLLRADELWCQGFSEPAAGSDLASLTTRAVRDGEDYVVSGQKIWTSQADRADWIFALVRTTPLEPGTKRSTSGISYLLIPMTSPGITVRPLRDISGAAHFAEVFFDEVRVPVANRIGAEGEGWSIMRTSLGHERATAFLADEFRYRHTVDRVVSLVIEQGLADDPLIRQQVAGLEIGVQSVAQNSARALAAVLRGQDPGAVASVNRLVKSEFEQRLHALALRATGEAAVLDSRADGACDGGRWTYGYLMSRATTIGAGTAETQRNTIAEKVLGLPSSRGERVDESSVVAAGEPMAVADDDERELRAALAGALKSALDPADLLDRSRAVDATDERLWSDLVGFGLPALHVPADAGGAGADVRLLCAAIEECAKVIAPVPLLPTVVAASILHAAGATETLGAMVSGSVVVPTSLPTDHAWGRGRDAAPVWDGTSLRGEQRLVPGAPLAASFLVPAQRDGRPVLLLVDRQPETVAVSAQQAFDRSSTIGTVTFDGAEGTVLAEGEAFDAIAASVRPIALLALGADAVGVTARAVALAVDWAGQREQFGRAIGSFQAVSHRIADAAVALEGARNQILGVAATIDETSPNVADLDCGVDLAVASALDAAITASESCIQVLGGIGFTWEHPAHLLLRRARSTAVLAGGADVLRDRAATHLLSPKT
ncbi:MULTISPECIES: acyl-CoA dehydrogenase family protein [Gordonia]|uniref:Acyl-CoA dehydrogenase family protein n=1 Tax=Gordonia amicalis TaxID=89053 RepID=A0AAE4RAA0_9ACTN|nr:MULTISPECIES: acyl-CoA dehydrogenase family protein [Gordonia]ATD70992.1 acyl-CoA dehydrogenase [Gordonia sp. 1D]MCZ4581362.1 acyl-CoA dehydrogenase family protein [Gordonia amicalis]MDJ0455262.1 acyl-CoA dehydrogenase family protein [Gordonia amicalis]MDV6314458.1 acyl-CoA dehydrogenase family protein [Gordonia amicalis]MDV7078719.1 acyl-CoA dehydrogenase family protein [Gordonia amicalis]